MLATAVGTVIGTKTLAKPHEDQIDVGSLCYVPADASHDLTPFILKFLEANQEVVDGKARCSEPGETT